MRSPSRLLSLLGPWCLGVSCLGLSCTDDATRPSEREGTVSDAVKVCADGDTVEGIDVSHWQGSVNWASVASDGMKFGFTRISNGTAKDETFDDNWSGMAAAGLVRGTYQYFRVGQDPIQQANLVITTLGELGPMDLPPALDLEGATNDGYTPTQWRTAIAAWVARIEQAFGRKPIIYVGAYFWNGDIGGTDELVDCPLWIPNYSYTCPDMPNDAWAKWTFFQNSSTESIGGESPVDHSFFNGPYAKLLTLVGPANGTGGASGSSGAAGASASGASGAAGSGASGASGATATGGTSGDGGAGGTGGDAGSAGGGAGGDSSGAAGTSAHAGASGSSSGATGSSGAGHAGTTPDGAASNTVTYVFTGRDSSDGSCSISPRGGMSAASRDSFASIDAARASDRSRATSPSTLPSAPGSVSSSGPVLSSDSSGSPSFPASPAPFGSWMGLRSAGLLSLAGFLLRRRRTRD